MPLIGLSLAVSLLASLLAPLAPPALAAPPAVLAAGSSLVAGPAAVAPRAPEGWRWPLAGTPAVARRFDPPPKPWLPGHRGVDLAAAAGDEVRAAGAGVVAFAGVIAGRGVVSVEHPNGLRTTYEPVDATVRSGDRVAVGMPLGRLAAAHPGCPVPDCLHWGLRRGPVYLNPLLLLRPLRVRLKPLSG